MGANEAAEIHPRILTARTVGHFAEIMREQNRNLCLKIVRFASYLYFKLSRRAGDVYIWKRRDLMKAVSIRVRVFSEASEGREEDKGEQEKTDKRKA